jgi:hypothetical protein
MEEISPEAPETGADEAGAEQPSEQEEGFADDLPEEEEQSEVPSDPVEEANPVQEETGERGSDPTP